MLHLSRSSHRWSWAIEFVGDRDLWLNPTAPCYVANSLVIIKRREKPIASAKDVPKNEMKKDVAGSNSVYWQGNEDGSFNRRFGGVDTQLTASCSSKGSKVRRKARQLRLTCLGKHTHPGFNRDYTHAFIR